MSTTLETFLGKQAVIASSEMREVLVKAQRLARVSAAILIDGESGSGKEIVARAVHHFSDRSGKPFVDVNCAALPEHLVESELFGFDRGAFTGALNSKPGLFELAQGGTLLLDEIGELPLTLQAKLLRVLDGAPFFRLGGTRRISVDARIIAATNRDLKARVREGLFREDLYYRLNEIRLRVPPLRERRSDIRALAEFFLNETRPGTRISSAALEELEAHDWPGNIRELRSVIMNAAVSTDALEIVTADLSLDRRRSWPVGDSYGSEGRLEAMERNAVLNALRETCGNRQVAAQELGISLRTLNRRLREYGWSARSEQRSRLGPVEEPNRF